jgi:5-methylcytosine-specific restriction endonuclease McrA
MENPERRHANDNRRVLVGPWPALRSVAKSNGSKYYFTGTPCCRGHEAPRITSSGACIECAAIWREEHKKEIADNYREWYAENKDRQIEYNRQYVNDNRPALREKSRIRAKKYREADPEKFAARSKEYYHRNMKDPEFRAKQSLRASIQHGKRKGAEGTFTPDDVAAILKRQRYKCAECGTSVKSKKNRHIDHITPLALGGSNWPWNLQILCPACNLSKGAKDPIEFARRKGRLL